MLLRKPIQRAHMWYLNRPPMTVLNTCLQEIDLLRKYLCLDGSKYIRCKSKYIRDVNLFLRGLGPNGWMDGQLSYLNFPKTRNIHTSIPCRNSSMWVTSRICIRLNLALRVTSAKVIIIRGLRFLDMRINASSLAEHQYSHDALSKVFVFMDLEST